MRYYRNLDFDVFMRHLGKDIYQITCNDKFRAEGRDLGVIHTKVVIELIGLDEVAEKLAQDVGLRETHTQGIQRGILDNSTEMKSHVNRSPESKEY